MVRTALLAGLAGCTGLPWNGTQIGVEHSGGLCDRVSSEVIGATEVPDGFAASPEDAFPAHAGTWDGFRYHVVGNEYEGPTDDPISLSVSLGEGEYVLERYQPHEAEVPAFNCPDLIRSDVNVTLEAPPDVSFAGPLSLALDEEDGAVVEQQVGPDTFAAIPDPSFDPAVEQDVAVDITLGHAPDRPWYIDVDWVRLVESEESDDEGTSHAHENIFWGWAGEDLPVD